MALLGNVACVSDLPGQIGRSSGTRDKVNKSGTVPEIPGQLEPMCTIHLTSLNFLQEMSTRPLLRLQEKR